MTNRDEPQSQANIDVGVIVERVLAGGELLPEQLPRCSEWSPEKELAATVLLDGLIEVRDFHNHPLHKRKVNQDLEWVFSDNEQWPYSFLHLCAALRLDPDAVRKCVLCWLSGVKDCAHRAAKLYRRAA